MYLSVSKTFSLDEIIKSFEVGFRSFIAHKLKNKYSNKDEFKSALIVLESKNLASAAIFSKKNQAKIKKLKSGSDEFYKTICDCYDSYINKTYSNNVPYVSNLIDYINLFYNECFSEKKLLNGFLSLEEFHFNCSEFLRIRNSLSHPASSKILTTEAGSVLTFVNRLCNNIDDNFFWYVSKEDIQKNIECYYVALSPSTIKVDNLNQIVSFHKKVVCRDDELTKLNEYIIGKNSYCRVAGSVVLFGYGGVGKTALVIDFLHNLIRVLKDERDKYNFDFILFYSSKDEYLKQGLTSGELYIDRGKAQIDDFESFKSLLFDDLEINTIDECGSKYSGGIVVIDNIENLGNEEKNKFFEFIKETPRNIQFIITSRNEEPCEEKLHIKEFRSHEKGAQFINEYIQSEGLSLEFESSQLHALIDSSKGNTLILVQCLAGLNEGTISLDEVISNLENIKSKSVEVIADFMYKNTFERAISDLECQGFDPKTVIRVMSLYEEKIDLYSISKLSKIDIGSAESICQHLLKKLIINKSGEYYSINEFANSFIFIKLLPSNYETNNILSLIRDHKSKMSETLESLKQKCSGNSKIKIIMDDWKPRNYIDRIVIAEAFETFNKIIQPLKRKDIPTVNRILSEYSAIELVTNHPYIRFQKARIYRQCLNLFKGDEYEGTINNICRSYDDAIEAIHFSHPFIRGTKSHGAVLMLYGIFLGTVLKDNSRSIRNLEEAAEIFIQKKEKNYFTTLNYLVLSCVHKHNETNDPAFKHKYQKAIKSILEHKELAKSCGFEVRRFERKFSSYI